MDRMQPSGLKPPRNHPPGEPNRKQLEAGDNAVLTSRQASEHGIQARRGNFDTYTVLNLTLSRRRGHLEPP
jgi:hypothetical protein